MKDRVEIAAQALEHGNLVLVLDDASSHASGYLVAAARMITHDTVCAMVNIAKGIICAAIPEKRLTELGLPMMSEGSSEDAVDFAVSIDARQGITTGISAADRARTLRALASTMDAFIDLVMPGHIFPQRAKPGGVLVRSGIAEAAVDLLTVAKVGEVAAVCHCLDEHGEILDKAGVERYSRDLAVPLVAVSDIVRYRMARERIVEKVAEAKLPTVQAGEFRAICFKSLIDGAEHLALVKGNIDDCDESGAQLPILVRVQAENRLRDLIGAGRVRKQQSIGGALERINQAGRGILVYVRHPRQGFLAEQVASLSEKSARTNLSSQLREFGIGAQILACLGAHRIRLLTSSVKDISGIAAFQLELVDRVSFSTVAPEARANFN